MAGGDVGTAAAITRRPLTAAADMSKVKKLKGRVMEDPISDEDDMFAEKSVPRRLTKDTEEFLLERNKKYDISSFCEQLIKKLNSCAVYRVIFAFYLFLLLARYVPNVAKEEYMRSV